MIFKLVRDALLADSAVTAIVDQRVYSSHAPQVTTYPQIVLFDVDQEFENSVNGFENLINSTVQLDCFAKGMRECSDLSEAAHSALNLHTLNFRALLESQRYEYIDKPKTHRYSLDFSIWHS